MAGLTVNGAVSGLDTTSIIDSLVKVEGNQQTLLNNKKVKAQDASAAYASLLGSARTLATASRAVANTSAWIGVSATSTSSNVSATVTGSVPGALTFDVKSLAKAHAVIGSNSVNSTGASIAPAASTLTLTKDDGSTVSIDTGDGSLSGVVSKINASNSGIVAAAVQTSPGVYKLQVSATTTGTSSRFTLGGLTGVGTIQTLTAGSNAKVQIGDVSPGAVGYTVESTTNTFNNLLPGVNVAVSKVEDAVTVNAARDSSKIAAGIQGLVDAANTLLADAATYTKYDVSTKTGGPLTGSSAVRTLQQSILSGISNSGAAGVQVKSDGTLTFDAAAFDKAFLADPIKTAATFGAAGSFTPAGGVTGSVSLVRGGDLSKSGSYAVSVTTAAAKEQWSMPTGDLSGQTITLQRGTQTLTYTAASPEPLATSIANLNAKAATANIGITVAQDASGVSFAATSYGSAGAFTVSNPGAGPVRSQAGTDVAGTINGKAATGLGQLLTASAGTGDAAGLALTVNSTSTGALGSFKYTSGLAQSVLQVVSSASNADGGLLTTAKEGLDKSISDLTTQIAAWDTRLADKRAQLVKQFAAMEVALQKLKSSGSFLTTQSTTAAAASSS